MGGQMSVITKSGTNSWHGSLFHRYEGSALSARPQFLSRENNSVWNQFGGSLGGPIKTNKAFFFFAYEGYRQRGVVAMNASVPSQRFRDILTTSLPRSMSLLSNGLDACIVAHKPIRAGRRNTNLLINSSPRRI